MCLSLILYMVVLKVCACRYVPLGLSAWFKGVGVKNVHELGWWQEMQHPHSSLTLACVPAQVRLMPGLMQNPASSSCEIQV